VCAFQLSTSPHQNHLTTNKGREVGVKKAKITVKHTKAPKLTNAQTVLLMQQQFFLFFVR
jgi:hypothetical protein